MAILYVLARSRERAVNWQRMMRIDPKRCDYIHSVDSLRGLREPIVVVLSCEDTRPDSAEINDYLTAIKAIRIYEWYD